MARRHEAICPSCGAIPQLLISKNADANPFRDHIPLTVFDGDGKVVGTRHDHHRTPYFQEFHGKEVLQRAEHGQEVAAKEMIQETALTQEKKLARQV
jgi:hypothetical protein